MMNTQKRRWERGQSFVEASIGLVVLIILLGGLFDMGRAFLILTAVENAAGEGALYGASNPACLLPVTEHSPYICQEESGDSVQARVIEEGKPIVTIEQDEVSVTVESVAGIEADSILRVDVEYTYSPVTPLGFMIWGSSATVTASARQRIMSPPPPDSGYTSNN